MELAQRALEPQRKRARRVVSPVPVALRDSRAQGRAETVEITVRSSVNAAGSVPLPDSRQSRRISAVYADSGSDDRLTGCDSAMAATIVVAPSRSALSHSRLPGLVVHRRERSARHAAPRRRSGRARTAADSA